MSTAEIRNIVEAALLAAGKSLTLSELSQLFEERDRPEPAAIRAALESLAEDYAARPIEIKETGAGWRVQVRRAYAATVARLWPERPQRYSRALLETLALIAYRQPITRAEIESVRGVAVNPNITKTLLERQWIRVVGHRDLPGHPELLGTTRDFLEYFGLRSLDELPPLTALQSLGELDPQLELSVAGGADGAGIAGDTGGADGGGRSSQGPLQAADTDTDIDTGDSDGGDSDSGEAEEFDAAAKASASLLAAPPDDR
jgi:segregation and condensation protein B